jgi:nicotinamidase-related amidase
MRAFTKVGLDALLTPENCVLLLIDDQSFQLANVNSHEPTMVINNVTALAKAAKAFGIPTVLTTVNAERGGVIFKQIQAVFPDQKPIDRTFIHAWEDLKVVEAVKKSAGRNSSSPHSGQRCVSQCPRSTQWETATMCTWSPTRLAA